RKFSITPGGLLVYEVSALPRGVGSPDDALLLHPRHEEGRPVVADLQSPLDVARGGLSVAQNDLYRLLVEIAAVRLGHSGRIEDGVAVFILIIRRRDCVEILRRALRFEMADDLLHLLVRAEWSMHAADAAAACHVDHVALAE